MIGDAAWKDLLWERYQQHRSDSARHEREPQIFEKWAVNASWRDFVDLARSCLDLPAYKLDCWQHYNSVPTGSRRAFESTTLERRCFNDWLMARQIMKHLRRRSRRAYMAAKFYVTKDKVPDDLRGSLARAKRIVYDWLMCPYTVEAEGK